MGDSILHNPLFQAVLAPFAAALLMVMVTRLLGGRATGVAVAAGACLGYLLLEGVPFFPPPAAKDKIFYLVVGGGVLGLALDLAPSSRVLLRAVVLLFPAICLIWFAWRRLTAGPEGMFLLQLVLLWAGSALALWRLAAVAERDGALDACILLIAAAAAASGIAMLGASISLALLAAAVAAAAGALGLWLYGARLLDRESKTGAAALVLGGGGALVAVIGVMSLYTFELSQPALAVLLLVPFSGLAAGRLYEGGGRAGSVLSPLLLAAVAGVAALAAVGVAYFAA